MKSFTIASFNIRCYGFGGEYTGRKNDEHRDEVLSDLIQTHLSQCDVIVFQEICVMDRIKNILPENFKIYTYEHHYDRHQHVVIAVQNKYELHDPFDNNFTIDDVIINPKTSRPAMYGQLRAVEDHRPIAHIIGVHLKSGKFHSESRMDQWQTICNFANRLDPGLPTFFAGDFNTQSSVFTGKVKGDIALFDELGSKYSVKRLENQQTTYKTLWEAHQLDHIYYSGPAKAVDQLWVLDMNQIFKGEVDRRATELYFEWISDHLPVRGEFTF